MAGATDTASLPAGRYADRSSEEAVWKPRFNPWLIALTVTLASFMEVLDTSIANVALPHIAGGLSASEDEATWVLTSYLVSNAIILPLSGWFSLLIGRKYFYIGLRGGLHCQLVPVRYCSDTRSAGVIPHQFKAVGGGGLQPSEQAILADTFPPRQRGMAFAIYGIAVVTAPRYRPHPWRLDHRQLHLALDFLH